jgi:hypothetical protein
MICDIIMVKKDDFSVLTAQFYGDSGLGIKILYSNGICDNFLNIRRTQHISNTPAARAAKGHLELLVWVG